MNRHFELPKLVAIEVINYKMQEMELKLRIWSQLFEVKVMFLEYYQEKETLL